MIINWWRRDFNEKTQKFPAGLLARHVCNDDSQPGIFGFLKFLLRGKTRYEPCTDSGCEINLFHLGCRKQPDDRLFLGSDKNEIWSP